MSSLRQAVRKNHCGAWLISVEQLLRLINGYHGLTLILQGLLLSTQVRGVWVWHVHLVGSTLLWSRGHLPMLPHLLLMPSVILLLIHQIFIIIVFIGRSSFASFKSLPPPLQPPYLPHQCHVLVPDLLLPVLIYPLKHPV